MSSSSSNEGSPGKRRTEQMSNDPMDKRSSFSTRIISGSVGSLVTALAVTPLEVVKVHLQSAKTETRPSKLPRGVTLCPKGCGTFVLNNGLFDCVLPKSAVPYFDKFGNCILPDMETSSKSSRTRLTQSSGIIGMIRHIFKNEGFRGIYAGLGPTLVMGIPKTALYFSVYDELVIQMRKVASDKVDKWVPLISGSSARLLSSMATAPLELIRTRQASAVGNGQPMVGMVAHFNAIVQGSGFTGLYRGLAPTLWRDVPFSGIYWLCLENSKLVLHQYFLLDNPSTPLQQAGIAFLSGASSGMVAAACTTPFDVVKTRQQAAEEAMGEGALTSCNHDGHAVYETKTATRSNSIFRSLYFIIREEGLHGLWRGNQSRMLKVAPSCAIMITSYELGKRTLGSG